LNCIDAIKHSIYAVFLLYRKLQHLCCNFWNNKIVSLIPRPQAGLLSEAFL